MSARRIILSVTNDLVTDQRVHRTCTALHEAGYEVTLIGRLLPGSKPLQRPYRTQRMRLLFRRKALFYAEYNCRLFLRLLFSRADVYYANDTDTLPANYLAARLRRKALLYDSHELFTEVPELVGRPRVKRFWRRIEDCIVPRIKQAENMTALTVSQSFADVFRDRYGIAMGVVRNVPMGAAQPSAAAQAEAERLRARLPRDKHLLLYQGAVNVGRGVEWVMNAMPYLPDCHYVIAGVGDLYDELRRRAASGPAAERITFMGRLEPDVLRAFTASASMGLALLENRGISYYYTLPNRIADFIHAGVPILATDFPEVRRVLQAYPVGTLVPPQPFNDKTLSSIPPDPVQLAQQIHDALDFWTRCDRATRQTLFAAAAADLSWDHDKKILLHHIDTILSAC